MSGEANPELMAKGEAFLLGKAGDFESQSPFDLAHRLIQWATEMIGDIGCDRQGEIVTATKELYDKFIRPIDLPGIPNFVVEPYVDDLLCRVVLMTIEAAFSRICSDES